MCVCNVYHIYNVYLYIYIKYTLYTYVYTCMGFHGGSDGKESACNVGDLGSAMWETWVRSLGWEDPLGKGKT